MSNSVKVGDRIRLIFLDDSESCLTRGELGTVNSVDDLGTIHIDWDLGPSLGLIPGVDQWQVL